MFLLLVLSIVQTVMLFIDSNLPSYYNDIYKLSFVIGIYSVILCLCHFAKWSDFNLHQIDPRPRYWDTRVPLLPMFNCFNFMLIIWREILLIQYSLTLYLGIFRCILAFAVVSIATINWIGVNIYYTYPTNINPVYVKIYVFIKYKVFCMRNNLQQVDPQNVNLISDNNNVILNSNAISNDMLQNIIG